MVAYTFNANTGKDKNKWIPVSSGQPGLKKQKQTFEPGAIVSPILAYVCVKLLVQSPKQQKVFNGEPCKPTPWLRLHDRDYLLLKKEETELCLVPATYILHRSHVLALTAVS